MDFVRSFYESRKVKWGFKQVQTPSEQTELTVVESFKSYVDFDRDFRGFCAILRMWMRQQTLTD